jgi:hypothetical protein
MDSIYLLCKVCSAPQGIEPCGRFLQGNPAAETAGSYFSLNIGKESLAS